MSIYAAVMKKSVLFHCIKTLDREHFIHSQHLFDTTYYFLYCFCDDVKDYEHFKTMRSHRVDINNEIL